MKLINLLRKFKAPFPRKFQQRETQLDSLTQLCIIIAIAAAIWFGGEYFRWGNYSPLAQAETRFYVIVSLLLLWLLKFLLWDLDNPNALQYKDPILQKKLLGLQQRFKGACQFLKKTTVTHHGKVYKLNQLPWYLLIGPRNSGKTTLLAQSNVHFILQRQFSNQENLPTPSETCDWWATRDTCLIDVPSKYTTVITSKENKTKALIYPILWQFFLRLIKKQRGAKGLGGIVIVLPLPELMAEADIKRYHVWIRDLLQRLQDIQSTFRIFLNCQLVITKCDLLPGFTEFFAESGDDELNQAWGIPLGTHKNAKTTDIFTQRFNELIKKLNQQLLWRLHQERNPMARPYIKDFPLQVERLKEFIYDVLKRTQSSNLNLVWRGVYLTSAMQIKAENDTIINEPINTSQRAIQLFKEPIPFSRSYFIKQFITQGLATVEVEAPSTALQTWKRRGAYALSAGIISTAAIILGRDFQQGLQQTYKVQQDLLAYQSIVQQFHNAEIYLPKSLLFLNQLQQPALSNTNNSFNLFSLLSFYTKKSQHNASMAYQQALQLILLPEIRDHLAEFLKIPVNQRTELVYSALKTYLMLGDVNHLQADYVLNTIRQTLPKSLTPLAKEQLLEHLKTALGTNFNPIQLNPNVIAQARKYLTSIPSLQLSYIILKNIGTNSDLISLNWGEDESFFVQPSAQKIPSMFTASAFNTIISQQSVLAAQEATLGNWVLSNEISLGNNSDYTTTLIEQLRTAYVNNYINIWENVISNIQINTPKNLSQTDNMILNSIGHNSSLLQILQTIHDNTYFEPISSLSTKLKNIGILMDKSIPNGLLYQVFMNLQSLHEYIRNVLVAENESKAAFNIISNRLLHLDKPDAITQLRLLADRSPEPVKSWLNKITNDAWHFLMQEAGRYIDTSWREQVIRSYQADIAGHFPFGTSTRKDVALDKFTNFFGNQGLLVNFYNQNLQNLIDTSSADWRWKMLDNKKLPFSDETLRQIQQAMRINNLFFANNNEPTLQFVLQPLQLGKQIKTVKLKINEHQFIDQQGSKEPHVFTWPSKTSLGTALQLTLSNQKSYNQNFPGDWGLFKLVNQTFESMASKKAVVINFAMNENSAKYLLSTNNKLNPFLTLDFRHFHLPQQITEQKA